MTIDFEMWVRLFIFSQVMLNIAFIVNISQLQRQRGKS